MIQSAIFQFQLRKLVGKFRRCSKSSKRIYLYSISIMSDSSRGSLKDFEIISRLGQGAFAEVFKVRRRQDGQFYAMKKIRLTRMKEKDRNNALNEVRILASNTGQHIIEYKQAFYDEPSSSLCIIMENAAEGDLLKMIQNFSKKKGKVPEQEIWKALVHITRGLRSLHKRGILHRDLKAANIFLTSEKVYKIGDLNVSKVLQGGLAKTQTGTPYYASPQVWKDLPYGPKSDLWSLGCVLYEMAAQKPPFTAPDIQSLYKKICSGVYSRIPQEYSNDLASIISSLLKLNPADRPSADALISNPLVQQNYSEQSMLRYPFDLKNCELLETIKIKSRNYKQMNDVLPKAKYGQQVTSNKSQIKIEKDSLSIIQSKRVKSSFEGTQGIKSSITNTPKIRERTISSYNSKEVSIAAIEANQRIQKTPYSHKLPRKLPQITSNINIPSLRNSRVSKIPPLPISSNKTSRKKIQSLLQNPTLIDSKYCNKENLRRIGQNIIGRIQTSKDIAHS